MTLAKSALVFLFSLIMIAPVEATSEADLARAWGVDAAVLDHKIDLLSAAIERRPGAPVNLPPSMRSDLIRFASTSDRLAAAAETLEGAQDLACIFRGMSEEVGVQLDAIAAADGSPADTLSALARLEKAMEDAEAIANAAALNLAGAAPEATVAATGTCPAALR